MERATASDRDLSPGDYRVLSNFRLEIRRFLRFSEDAARAEGLEPQQHQMLLAIEGLGGTPTVGEIAEHLLLRHHSTVGLIDRMEERKLLERRRDGEDRRQVRVAVTAHGMEKLHHLTRIHREELRRSGPKLVEVLGGVIETVR